MRAPGGGLPMNSQTEAVFPFLVVADESGGPSRLRDLMGLISAEEIKDGGNVGARSNIDFSTAAGRAAAVTAVRLARSTTGRFCGVVIDAGESAEGCLALIEAIRREDPEVHVCVCADAVAGEVGESILAALKEWPNFYMVRGPRVGAELRHAAVQIVASWRQRQETASHRARLESMADDSGEALRYASQHDPLTELPNRASLCDRIAAAIRRRLECGEHFVVIMIDFDRFRAVNDSLGLEAGNRLLVVIADRLRQVISGWSRDNGGGLHGRALLGRMGGDEFLVVVDRIRTEPNQALGAAATLLDAARMTHEIDGVRIACTASIGATSSRLHYMCPSEVLRDVDAAMYRAKKEGKDRVVTFSGSMQSELKAKLDVEVELRRALSGRAESCGLVVNFQPIVECESGRVVAAEALARIRAADGRFISPGDFIPVAEEAGLIVDLGNRVLGQSAAALRDLLDAGLVDERFVLSVNVSKAQLLEPGLFDVLRGATERWGCPPSMLGLEVTESVVVENWDAALPVLERCRALGSPVAMDDFGVGQSSLTNLRRFPFSTLKVDRSFTESLSGDFMNASIMNAVIQLAHNLRMKVVVEGIESGDQLAHLQAMDCTFGQGYLFGRPTPFAAFAERLTKQDEAARFRTAA